jgi:hypothetical protein
VFAQGGDFESKVTTDRDSIEKKVYARVKGVINEAPSLRLVANRVRTQIIAACLLWPRDQTQARSIIRDATAALSSHIASPEHGDASQNRLADNRLRNELVWLVASLDSKLALELLRATRQAGSLSRAATEHNAQDPEVSLELSLAAQIVQQDSKLASQIAETSLNRGLLAGVVGLAARMLQIDARGASDLAARVMSRLKSEDLSTNQEAMNAALALVKLVREEASPQPNSGGDRVNDSLIDQQAYRELICMIALAAARLPVNRMNTSHAVFTALESIMPEVEKLLPTNQVTAIRQKRVSYEQSLNPRTRAWKSYEKLMEQGTVDALVEAAAKAPPEVSDELYARAAMKSLNENDPERARQAAGNITNPHQRASKMKEIEQQLFSRSAQQGKVEEAGEQIPPAASIEERVSSLIHLANVATTKGQKSVARRYLEDALGLVPARAENQFHFSTQLQIAHAFASVDLNRSFEILEAAIDRLNDLLDAASLLDGFGGDFFKDGELKPFNGGMWEELLRQCYEELAAIAPEDAERALSAAGKLRRAEAQTLATLRVAQRVLSERNDRNASRSRK